MRKFELGVGVCAMGWVLAGCSSDSSSVSSLEVPAQVQFVDAQNSGSLTLSPGVLAVTYDEDPTQFWIHDDSMEALDTVNMILCSVQQTRFDHASVLNAGPYVALVACEERGGEQSGAGRGGDAATYERFVVDSKRAGPGDPHIVDFWLDTTAPDASTPAIIYGKVTITESPSDSRPFGAFEMHFKQLLASQAHDDPNVLMSGYLKTVDRDDNQAEFAFFNSSGDVTAAQTVGSQAFRQRARLVGMPGGAGRAYSENRYAYNPGTGTVVDGAENFVQFNSSYLARRSVTGSSVIKVFDRNDFNTSVYRYGVYNASTNQRVEQLSGFGVEDANGVHGWAGYHGLWFPSHVTLTDGATLTRRSYEQGGQDETYLAVVVPGILEKRTRSNSTLGNLKNEDLEIFDPTSGTEIRVQWNGTDLMQVATRSGGSWTTQTPASISSSYQTDDWLNFYSQSRGNVQLVWPASAPTDNTVVHMWTHETITADSAEMANGNLTLYGYRNCLKPLLTSNQANFTSAETPFYPDATDVTGVRTYTFNKNTLMLEISGSEVRLGDGVTVSGGPGQFGFECGPLFATSLSTLSEAASQTTTYTWRTGTNQWNQLRTIKTTGGAFVAFDPPMRMSYTHNEPTNTLYHGKTYSLEWTGSDLHGVPFSEGNDNRWRPGFNIPSGTEVTVGNTTYKIKQLEGEQEMVEVGSPSTVIASQGFDLDVILTAPVDETQDPAIGAMPDLDEPPLFVAGVAQNEDGE